MCIRDRGYDQRLKYFGGKGFILGRKGTAWLKYKLDENRTTPIEGEELKQVLSLIHISEPTRPY